MKYTAVIRTLGTAGEKYQKLLDSLIKQTVPPCEIIVYIAESYPLPRETVGVERYIYVKKGMVAQRALSYDEVTTEYILFLDDDLTFPSDTVEKMYHLLKDNNADVIAPDIFPNSMRPWKSELMMTLSGRMRARRKDKVWGYKVMRTSGYSYNKTPKKDVYISQTNAGACFLCRKDAFLKIHFEEELWMDKMTYALGDDQVMYYKMYLNKLKVLTWYEHQFTHLDAGHNMTSEKEQMRLYSDLYFKNVFWHRFIFSLERRLLFRLWSILCIFYSMLFTVLISLLRFNIPILTVKCRAILDAWKFINSEDYRMFPPIVTTGNNNRI